MTSNSPYSKIVSGASHSCGIDSLGDVYCWQENQSSGLSVQSASKVKVPQGARADDEVFTDIESGDFHTCATTDANNVYCWGPPSSALGDGSAIDGAKDMGEHFNESLFPRQVPEDSLDPGDEFVSVHLGRMHTCGVTRGGKIYCWGEGVDGGDDAAEPVHQPGDVLPNPPAPIAFENLCDGKVKDTAASADSCPYGYTYSYEAPFSYCKYSGLEFPDASGLKPYCHYTSSGYQGFMWNDVAHPDSYQCPFGFRHAPNGSGQYYCVYEGIPAIAGVELKYQCDLPSASIGFKWCSNAPISVVRTPTAQDNTYACPANFTKSYDGTYNYCLRENVSAPDDSVSVNDYCQYVNSGYLGFSWLGAASPNGFSCPSGTFASNNGAGTNFCLITVSSLPATVSPHCHIAQGKLGFRW